MSYQLVHKEREGVVGICSVIVSLVIIYIGWQLNVVGFNLTNNSKLFGYIWLDLVCYYIIDIVIVYYLAREYSKSRRMTKIRKKMTKEQWNVKYTYRAVLTIVYIAYITGLIIMEYYFIGYYVYISKLGILTGLNGRGLKLWLGLIYVNFAYIIESIIGGVLIWLIHIRQVKGIQHLVPGGRS